VISSEILLTMYDIKSGTALFSKDLPYETTSLIYNDSINSSLLGTKSGEILFFHGLDFSQQPEIITKFSSPIRKLGFSQDGQKILVINNDSALHIISKNAENSYKTLKCIPGHMGGIKSGAISRNGKYAGSTGKDGFVRIYKIENEKIECIAELKICEYSQANELKIDLLWNYNSTRLYITGSTILKYIDINSLNIQEINEIKNTSEINAIEEINENFLLLGYKEKCVKLLRLSDFQFITQIILGNEPNEIKYYSQLKYIAISHGLNLELSELPEKFLEMPKKINPISEKIPDEIPAQNDAKIQENQSEKPSDKMPKNNEKLPERTKLTDEEMKEWGAALIQDEEEPENLEKQQILENPIPNHNEEEEYKELTRLDHVVDSFPQERFQVNETQFSNNARFLCWNNVGSIALMTQRGSSGIFIDFTNKTFHRNLSLPDYHGFSMGAMSYSGAILASRAEELDINKYQEDDENERISYIQYISFNDVRGRKGWERKLPEGENAEAVAVGSRWVAVYTDLYHLRIFSNNGDQNAIFAMPTPVVTMCGFENLLAVVYHSGVPIKGNQRLAVKIYEIGHTCDCTLDISVPLSPGSTLKWAGFSEEGQLFTQDTKGVIRALLTFWGNTWIPVYKGNIWIVNIGESEIIGIDIKTENYEPQTSDKNLIRVYKFKIPVIQKQTIDKSKNLDSDENYILNTIKIQQEIVRKQNWGHLKLHRKKHDPEYAQSLFIQSDNDILASQKSIDLKLLDKLREALLNGEYEKSLTYAEMMLLTKTLNTAVDLAQKMGNSEISKKIAEIFIEKKREENRKMMLVLKNESEEQGKNQKKKLVEYSAQVQTTVLEDIKENKKYGEVLENNENEEEMFMEPQEAQEIEEKEGQQMEDVDFVQEMYGTDENKGNLPENEKEKMADKKDENMQENDEKMKGKKRELEDNGKDKPTTAWRKEFNDE